MKRESSVNSEIKPLNKDYEKYRGKYRSLADISTSTLEALRSGEEWAFNEVHAAYALPLKDFITALIRNEDDAVEINHEVFIALWTGREKIVPEKGIRGFLYMRAKNLVMNYFDHKKVRQKYLSFKSGETDYEFAADQSVIANETKILIEIAVQGMTPRKQAIYRMKFEEGKTVKQIALELNIETATVSNYISLITKSLRKVIAIYILLFIS